MPLIRTVIGILTLLCSTYSLAASTLSVSQSVYPVRMIGAALPQSIGDRFTLQTGYSSNYSKSLEYSTGPIIDSSGNPVSQGQAKTSLSFDLSRGEFKLYSESLLPDQWPSVGQLISTTNVTLYDFLTVHSPTATTTNPVFLTLHLETDGDLSLLNSNHPEYGSDARLDSKLTARNQTDPSTSFGSTGSGCSYGEACSSYGAPFFSGGSFATVASHLTDGGKNEITLRVPLYHETSLVQFDMTLNTTTSQGVVDLSHTARLFIDIPGGSFTSESGIMSAVPEPETYAMMLAGLGFMGFMIRRRQPA